MWPDRRFMDLVGTELPIVLAPMAGPGTAELAMRWSTFSRVARPMRRTRVHDASSGRPWKNVTERAVE